MPLETTTACVRLLVFFRIRRGNFPYGVEDDVSTISLTPTTHYTNTCAKLTIVTHLSFSERIAIANLSLLFFCEEKSQFVLFCVYVPFLFLFFLLPCFRWSFVDVALIFSCSADLVPDWQPRILLGRVEVRSVNNVKNIPKTIR